MRADNNRIRHKRGSIFPGIDAEAGDLRYLSFSKPALNRT
jgi:hypothetical protein